MKEEFKELILRHVTQIRVRYADTDKMGVVNNVKYLEYFEVGRSELMRHYGMPYSNLEKLGYLLPVVSANIEYKNSAFYDELISIEAIYRRERKPVIQFEYNIFKDNTTIAKGYTIHCFLDENTRKPVKPPKEFWQGLSEIEKMLNNNG